MEFFENSSIFLVLLTLSAYLLGEWCRKKTGIVLCNPFIVAVVTVIGVLFALGIDNSTYQEANQVYAMFLTPATICLALPLYRQLKVLRSDLRAVLAGVLAGTLVSLLTVLVPLKIMNMEQSLVVSILPKGITTALAVALSEEYGGMPSIAAAMVACAGTFGSIFGQLLCRLFHIHSEVAVGVAYGTASHVIGTSKASESSETAGAAGSLALIIAGLLTAVLFPVITAF